MRHAGAGKLPNKERVVEIAGRIVGVPVNYFPALGTVLLADAAGIVAGSGATLVIVVPALLVVYFLDALAGHLRVGNTKSLAMPVPHRAQHRHARPAIGDTLTRLNQPSTSCDRRSEAAIT